MQVFKYIEKIQNKSRKFARITHNKLKSGFFKPSFSGRKRQLIIIPSMKTSLYCNSLFFSTEFSFNGTPIYLQNLRKHVNFQSFLFLLFPLFFILLHQRASRPLAVHVFGIIIIIIIKINKFRYFRKVQIIFK